MQIWYEVQVQSSEGQTAAAVASENADVFALPERPAEPPCAFYLKTGQCKFGATCKFHHPKDIQIPSAKQEYKIGETGTTIQPEGTGFAVKPPALSFNSKGLPVRPGEPDCPFYLKTRSFKYGATWAQPKRTEKGTMRRWPCSFSLPKAQSINCNFYFHQSGMTSLCYG